MGQQAIYLLAATLATLLLQLGAGLLGPAGIFVNLFTPLPAAFVCMRKGMLSGGGAVVLTAGILFAGGEAPGSLAYLLQFGIGSLVLPLLLRKGWSWDRAVAGAVVATVGAAALVAGGYAAHTGLNVNELVGQYVQAEFDRAMAIYQNADLPAEQVGELRAVAHRMAEFMTRAYPGLALVFSGAVMLFVVFFLSALSPGRYVLAGPSFHLWKLPEQTIWLLILAGFGMVFAEGPLQLAAMNLLAVFLPLYFLQGLAIVNFYFRKKGIAPALRVLGYVMIALLNPIPLIVTGIGVFDLWADFRKPRIKKT